MKKIYAATLYIENAITKNGKTECGKKEQILGYYTSEKLARQRIEQIKTREYREYQHDYIMRTNIDNNDIIYYETKYASGNVYKETRQYKITTIHLDTTYDNGYTPLF